MIKKASFSILVVFFILAGFNHFRDPGFYLPLIPEYLPFPEVINYLSGALEILLGVGLISKFSRKWAVYGIIAMLVAFLPSHIYFIEKGGCLEGGLCVPLWVAWVRLVVIHPLLIAWVWYHRK